jgi:hypothetical protein
VSSVLAPRPAEEPAAELAVVVGCHGLVCTFPVRLVERLVLRDEVEVVPRRARRSGPLPQVVRAADEAFVAWNLGSMLDLPPVTVAWVLLRVPVGGGEPVPLALRTGPCLMVQPAPELTALPPGLFRARGRGIVGAFATASLRGQRVGAGVGIAFDPARLWTTAELESSRAALGELED